MHVQRTQSRNWIALFSIFNPVDPIWVGCVPIQGLFLQRRHEVAAVYSELLTEHFFNFQAVGTYVVRDPAMWPRLWGAALATTRKSVARSTV